MTAKQVLTAALKGNEQMLGWYLGDLSDADILVRPVPEANHIAWQLGHLIAAEKQLVCEQMPTAAYPALPAGFVEAHSKATARNTGPDGFLTKAVYLAQFAAVRAATLAALDSLTDAELDRPTIGSMAGFAPTLASLFLMLGDHVLMHAGQFSVVRRKLGKPVLF